MRRTTATKTWEKHKKKHGTATKETNKTSNNNMSSRNTEANKIKYKLQQ